jgi:hypothetical protein
MYFGVDGKSIVVVAKNVWAPFVMVIMDALLLVLISPQIPMRNGIV